MIIKSTWLCLGLLWLSLSCIAQNTEKFRRLTSETGLNIQTTLDSRYTANPVQYLGFQTRTGYEFGAANKITRIELSFAKNFDKVEGVVNYVNLNSGIRYTHLRATKRPNFYVGGYLDYGNLLVFPRGAEFTNNPITYTFWLSIGAAANWTKQIQIKQQKLNVSVNGALPLLGYVIRPAYAHPYAENYLVDLISRLSCNQICPRNRITLFNKTMIIFSIGLKRSNSHRSHTNLIACY